MQAENKNLSHHQQGQPQNFLKHESTDEQKALNESAHTEADKDMEKDAEISAHNPNDDLDEGESARLGEEISEII